MRILGTLICLSLFSCASTTGRAPASKLSSVQQAAQAEAQKTAQARLRLDAAVRAEPAPFEESDRVSVVVLPFEVSESSGNRGGFESVYMASSFAETLLQSPWVADAYVSPVPTDAVDIVIEGEVLQSAPNAVDVKLVCRRGDASLLTQEYGIRIASSDFGGQSSPLRRIWNRPTNELGKALFASGATTSFTLEERVARYVGQPGIDPSERVVQLFQKASEIEHAKLLEPVSLMVAVQVAEVEASYLAWQRDSIRAREQAARYRKQAADARAAANKLKKQAKTTAAAGIGLSLLRGYAAVESGSQLDSVQMQADLQQFLDVADKREAQARETMAEAEHAARQAEVAFQSENRFAQVFESNLTELTVTLEDRVYTLVGAVDAQIAQLRTIIRDIAQKEIEVALAEATLTESVEESGAIAAAAGEHSGAKEPEVTTADANGSR